MFKKLFSYKFELFFISQVAILFGSLLIPNEMVGISSLILFYVNILTGSLFIFDKQSHQKKLAIALLVLIASVFILADVNSNLMVFVYMKLGILFLFHIIVTFRLISKIWQAKIIGRKVILGMMSGYISLGFIGYFIFTTIILLHPDSFTGLVAVDTSMNTLTDQTMYFSYITLMTIGYGEIVPISHLAQKATVLLGMMGQFYLVIITGIVMGKYINQKSIEKVEK